MNGVTGASITRTITLDKLSHLCNSRDKGKNIALGGGVTATNPQNLFSLN